MNNIPPELVNTCVRLSIGNNHNGYVVVQGILQKTPTDTYCMMYRNELTSDQYAGVECAAVAFMSEHVQAITSGSDMIPVIILNFTINNRMS